MNIYSPYATAPFANRTTSALSAYPGGIGYANRLQAVGGWEDFLNPLIGKVGGIATGLLDRLLAVGQVKAKLAMGYRTTGAVTRVSGRDYVVMTTPNGTTVGVADDGSEIPMAQIQGGQSVDPKTGFLTGTTATIGTLAIVAVAAAILLSRRR